MRIDVRIDCSANEFRRLAGQPDLLPLAELAGVTMERWLQECVLEADQMRGRGLSRPPEDAGGEAGKREMKTHGRRRSDRG